MAPSNSIKSPIKMKRPIRLAGSTLGGRAHICSFFNTRDDEYEVLQFELRDWGNTHLRGGRFDPRTTLALFEEVMKDAKQRGFRSYGLSLIWSGQWKLNCVRMSYWNTRRGQTMCGFAKTDQSIQSSAFTTSPGFPEAVVDVLRTHPLVIIGGILQENPFFVPPDEFLEQLRARRNGLS